MNAYTLSCMRYEDATLADPSALWDMHYLRDLDMSGFIDELLDDEPLRALVSLCNEIYFVPFVANVEGERQFFNQNFPCFLGDFDGSCKIVLRHSADPE